MSESNNSNQTNSASGIIRFGQHVASRRAVTRKAFPTTSLANIEKSIVAAESGSSGQVRFVVETDLTWLALKEKMSARDRAIQLFSSLHVWDTEHNNGILLYVLFAEKKVEIVADRGIDKKVMQSDASAWQSICSQLEISYKRGQYDSGTIAAIAAIGQLLKQHFAIASNALDELPNSPILI